MRVSVVIVETMRAAPLLSACSRLTPPPDTTFHTVLGDSEWMRWTIWKRWSRAASGLWPENTSRT